MLPHRSELEIIHVLEGLLLPPGGPILLLLFCLILFRRKMSFILLIFALLVFYFSSIPHTQQWLYRYIRTYPPVSPETLKVQAIVVIGGGRHSDALEYGGDTVSHLTLQRIRYAAWLQRKTGLPILVSGGGAKPGSPRRSEAELMTGILREEFSAQVRWLETRSRTTFENAQFSAPLLGSEGIRRIALVTHAYHMPRAVDAFEKAGFEVTPAPTVLLSTIPEEVWYMEWIPGARAAFWNRLYLHELIGRQWYRWRYRSEEAGNTTKPG